MTVPKKQSAVAKIERSKLNPDAVQRELMGADLDLQKLLVYLKGKVQFDSIDRVTDIEVTRTIEGASTVKVSISDSDRAVLNSGVLADRLDIQIDGLWFRLVKVEKTDDILALTFEDREIAILRTYKKLKIAHRSQVTRAEFVNNLIREVKEEDIRVVIPELHKVQAIQKAKDLPYSTQTVVDKTGGIPETVTSPQEKHRHGEQTSGTAARPSLTVKGQPIDKDQVKNANAIIATGQTMGARRKVLVASIMTSIQEATLRNLPYGDTAGPDSLGLFQQRASWGSAEARLDPATSARLFFNKAIVIDRNEPTIQYTLLCQEVQRSAFPNAYAQWQDEAERIVSAYGVVGKDNEGTAAAANNSNATTTDGSNYMYYRGIPMQGGKSWKKEDSWACISRLADEVQWRNFFVSGVFYYITEDDLFKSKPIAEVRETDEGIERMDGDLDTGKKVSTLEIDARIGTWLVPPGAVIVVEDFGPWTGRWLVSEFKRSLFDSKATITLKKPQARLPEPLQNDINTTPPTWAVPSDSAPTTSLTGPVFGGVLPDDLKGTAAGVVAVAQRALAAEKVKHYHYLRTRPYPDTLWSDYAHTHGIDCSSFAILCYKEASCQDPSGKSFNGTGYTGDLVIHGFPVVTPVPGDLVFYLGSGTRVAPGHVAIYIGAGNIIEIGSDNGILQLPVNYRTDILEYRRYIT